MPLWADILTLALVGASSKTLGVHLRNHAQGTFLRFQLTLWQKCQLGNFGGEEQHGGAVGAGSGASTTTNTSGSVPWPAQPHAGAREWCYHPGENRC